MPSWKQRLKGKVIGSLLELGVYFVTRLNYRSNPFGNERVKKGKRLIFTLQLFNQSSVQRSCETIEENCIASENRES